MTYNGNLKTAFGKWLNLSKCVHLIPTFKMAGEWKIQIVLSNYLKYPKKLPPYSSQCVSILWFIPHRTKKNKTNENKNLNPFIYSFVFPLLAFKVLVSCPEQEICLIHLCDFTIELTTERKEINIFLQRMNIFLANEFIQLP